MQEVVRSLTLKHKIQKVRQKINSFHLDSQKLQQQRIHYTQKKTSKILNINHQHFKVPFYDKLDLFYERKIYHPHTHKIRQPILDNAFEYERSCSQKMQHSNQFIRKISYFGVKNNQNLQIKSQKKLSKQSTNQQKKNIKIQQVTQRSQITNDFQQQSSQKSAKSSKFPQLKKRGVLPKLKSYAIIIRFCVRLKNRYAFFLKEKKKLTVKKQLNFGAIMKQAVKQFYFKLLELQIISYLKILEKNSQQIKQRDKFEKQILDLLTKILNKVSELPVPKHLFESVCLMCGQNSFFPYKTIFLAEAERLQFSELHGCSLNVKFSQSLMIIACLFGIKILCYNFLFRPWIAHSFLSNQNQKVFNPKIRYNRLKSIINNYGSIIYYLIIDLFVVQNPIIQTYKSLEQLDVKYVHFLTTEPKKSLKQQKGDGQQQDNQSNRDNANHIEENEQIEQTDDPLMLVGQSRKYSYKIKLKYKSQINLIEFYLSKWFKKIASDCLNELKANQQKRVLKFIPIKL